MIKRLIWNIFAFSPILIAVAAINFVVDPANIFSGKAYVKGIADMLLNNQNVEGIYNYDERLLQKEMATRIPYTPEILVLGSSRTMEIGQTLFPNKKVWNAGVSHGWIKDVIAVFSAYTAKGTMPKTVIIGTDPWLVDAHDGDEWKSIRVDYNRMAQKLALSDTVVGRMEGIKSSVRKSKELLSPEYFQQSIKFIQKNGLSKYSATTALPDKGGRLTDNTVYYERVYRTKSASVVHQENMQFLKKHPEVWLSKPSEKNKAAFEAFLAYLLKQKIEVVFYMSPMHPDTYQHLMKRDGILTETNTYFRTLAQQHQIRVVGDLDPAVAQVTDAMFYDYFHCNREALARMFAATAN